MTSYDFNEHRHNFATWTAARASQRGFAKTPIIKTAIESSGLRRFAEMELDDSSTDFESFHKSCAFDLIDSFRNQDFSDVSYGRAAKIISIYLKTSVILTSKGDCRKSRIIHPPIDNILLTKIASIYPSLRHLKSVKWTTLSENAYWSLVKELKSEFTPFDWTLERFWQLEVS
ncbi:hypothetical protein [Fibrella aquatilis]|uniref:Uncharacterized protein n=1 Tax=Fibrella aquatilis TaxID=2817059 RepID=A0A939G1Z2_9BACT|nr:hypothetical protein [Fibrella aquatilis]MBO0930559.1 hypothetical protein [Fibrella aquatilis]